MRSRAGVDDAKSLLARGQYKDAIAQLERAVAATPTNADALATLLRARLEVGDYRKAFEQGEQFLRRSAKAVVAETTAEAAFQIGEYERAVALLDGVSTTRAAWLRGLIAARNGQTDVARAAFEQVAGVIGEGKAVTSEERALTASAFAKLGRFKDANEAYRDAVRGDAKNATLKTEWGKLLAAKHNPADAQGLFREALEANPSNTSAMVGLAEIAAQRWEGRAAEWALRALRVNPNLAEALLLLARQALEQDDFKTADEHIAKTLEVNPRLLEAWSLRTAGDYLKAFLGGDNSPENQAGFDQVLKENPRYGKVFAEAGDFCLLKRQFSTAVEFYRRALALDPTLDDVRSSLGINLFRLGEEQEARTILEEAYSRDPYNVWTVNTLRLMDSFSRFDTFETPHFAVKLQKKESETLRPYVAELLEKALQNLSARYKFTLPQKVTFEMYPDHEDFAVRTLGLPGLGALGATLGNVVAMDSPSARPVGAFHWASTLWHELAHVVSIGLTSGRVPRWFTEGLSVYEETQARPGWGDPMDSETVQALRQRKLLPLADLNGAFVHPDYPGRVQFAYFQGGLICQYIVEKYGFPKILAMLSAYAQGRSDADAIRDELGVTMAEFDSAFLKYAREQTFEFAEAVDLDWAPPNRKVEEYRQEVQKHPRNFLARLNLASVLWKEGKLEEAAAEAQAAKELFPVYVAKNSPYGILADIYEKLEQKEKAIAELKLWQQRKGRDPETFKRLAGLLKDAGRTDEAIRTLEELMYVSMFDPDAHNLLGDWYLEASNPQGAVKEYRIVLALGPADKAGAHYKLANAYRALADDRSARQEVLAALEIAPGFRPAQKLLLELTGK